VAYFTQNVVAAYERYYNALADEEISQGDTETLGKECSNLIVLISELYNFQVISCVLVYDIIRGLLDKEITEFNVELLLKIVRSTCPDDDCI
jgi:nucleolar MIF4G domain-containing protein 1